MEQATGLYISVPFCRAKCTFCNFASDAFGEARLHSYLDAVLDEVHSVHRRASALGAVVPRHVDTVYFGGGTPSLLHPDQIRTVFGGLRSAFAIDPDAEITVECAPGQLSDASLEEFVRQGVSRLSFGAQSFVDRELRAIGRKHVAADCLKDLTRARAAGISRLSCDLIAGLPGQTKSSWQQSLDAVLASGVGHASIYMLEIDAGSRLGREVLTGGARYGAGDVPTDDQSVAFYEAACDLLTQAGLEQYEISNFAREGQRSAHNLRYWRRLPYLGFGLDAHSMLPLGQMEAVRFSNADDLDHYLAKHTASASQPIPGPLPFSVVVVPPQPEPHLVHREQALEEALFLGLRLNSGVSLDDLSTTFGSAALALLEAAISLAQTEDLLSRTIADSRQSRGVLRLTRRGRALSNEVFARLLDALEPLGDLSYPLQEETTVA